MTPLRQRMREDMQVRNLSPHTQRAYIENVARFARHFGRSPVELGPEEIHSYQVYLTRERKLAPSSLGIAVCALRFLYKVTLKQPWSFDDLIPAPKKPRRLPVVLSPDEVVRALECVTSPKHRAVLTTCYAAGLRISEAVRLRPRDLDSQRMVIRIEQGKGQRDRYVMLSPKLLAVLRDWWRLNRPTTWLFPGERPDHPLGRAAVEQACHRARRRARLTKPLTPHMYCGTVSRSISWKPAPMSGRSSSCLAITVSRRPPGIFASPPRRSARPPALSTCSHGPSGPRRLPSRRQPADARSWTVRRWRWRTSSAGTATPIVP